MTSDEWNELCSHALDRGAATVCLDGLSLARLHFGTSIPGEVATRLADAPADEPASNYLLASGQAARALSELGAVQGLARKVRFAMRRLLPPSDFMRAKYPQMQDQALVLLYLRRLVELLRKRPERSGR